MESSANLMVFCIVVFSAVITLVICRDVSYQTEITPNNDWPRLGANKHTDRINGNNWGNSDQIVSTPWPFTEDVWPPNQSKSTGEWLNAGFPRQQETPHRNTGPVEDEQLRTFSENLLQRESNSPARYVTVHYQGKTTSNSKTDKAPNLLLQIQPEAYNIPTIEKLLRLHDNYIPDTNVAEEITLQEKDEENNFIDKIMETQIMEFTRNFLIQKGRIGTNLQDFKNILKEIWFTMYPRGGGKLGSSGFEHVFLGELKNHQVSGLHNWLYFSKIETDKQANYLGYMKKIEFGNKGAILKHHFQFHNVDKPVASMFIGTSPELEIALYSTCFLLRPDQVCPLRLGGNNFIIRAYTFKYQGKTLIGSAFPEI